MVVTKNNGSKLKVIDLTQTATVNSGADDTQELKPSSGYIYIVRGIFCYIADPSGSTSGTHDIRVFLINGGATRHTAIVCKANTGSAIGINHHNLNGDSLELPSDVGVQNDLLTKGSLMASYDYPIDFNYNNDTDANQTGTRTLKILVEEIPERS